MEVACRVGIFEDEEDGVGASFGKGRKKQGGSRCDQPVEADMARLPVLQQLRQGPQLWERGVERA